MIFLFKKPVSVVIVTALRRDLPLPTLPGFLNKKIMDLKTYYERALFLESGYEDIVKNSESFYDLTVQRDEAFVEKMLEKLAAGSLQPAEKGQKAILITGGYHTSNLKDLLKQKGISYVSITPQVYQE